MKCKFCGARIGILERWRFGDFCSKEHRDEFAEDLVRLNEQIVQDLRRLPKLFKAPGVQAKPEAEVPEPNAVQEPDPPMGEFVALAEDDPRPWGKPAKVSEEVQPKPTKGDQWRMFSRIADWEGLPPTALAASQKKQSRFVWIHVAQEPSEGPHGSLVPATYPAFLPHPQLRKWTAQMPAAAIVRPHDPQRIAAQEARTRAVPAPRKQWIDEDGWRWIPERASVEVPDFRNVLMEYPISAPWTQWTMAPPPPPIAPLRPLSSPGQSPAGSEQHAPAQSAQPIPAQAPAPPPPAATPYPPYYAAASPPGPAYMAPVPPAGNPAPVAAIPPGAYPAPMVPYPSIPSGYVVPQPWGAGLSWRELPPPFFSALVDIAHDLKPLAMAPVIREITPRQVESQPSPAACRPRLAVIFSVGLPWVDCQGDPSEDLTAQSGAPRPSRIQPRTLWRRQLVLPRPVEIVGGPRIPNTAPPRFVLALRPAPPLPGANPVLLHGRWNS